MHSGGLMALIAYGTGDIMPSCNYSNNYSHNLSIQNKKLNENNKHRAKNIKKTIKFKNFMNHNKYDQQECVICLYKFKKEDIIIVRTCKHIYHKKCDDKAIIKCPTCRQ